MIYSLCRSTGTWLRVSRTKGVFTPKITFAGHPAEHRHLHFIPTSHNSPSHWKTPRHQLDLASSWPLQDGHPTRQQCLRKGSGPAPRGPQLLAPGGQALVGVPAPPRCCHDQLGCAGRTGYLCTCSSRQSWERTFEQHGEVIFWLTLVSKDSYLKEGLRGPVLRLLQNQRENFCSEF